MKRANKKHNNNKNKNTKMKQKQNKTNKDIKTQKQQITIGMIIRG